MTNDTPPQAEFVSSREARVWQSIESAPLDGTVVDLWVLAPDGIHGKRIANVLWDTNRSFNGGIGRVARPDAWVNAVGRTELWPQDCNATHWMLPPSGPSMIAAAPPQAIERSAREDAVTGTASEMPTIWEDPAGKGYPCFERPMTAAEARNTVEHYGRQLAEYENEKRSALATLSPIGEREREQIARIVDPEIWEDRDLYVKLVTGNGLGPLEGSHLWTADMKVAASLAKADAILAVIATPVIGEGGK